MHTVITCTADGPSDLAGIEYNNIYPGKAGRCFMFADSKEFDCTLLTDRAGVVWRFPHQHLMHYSRKIRELAFAPGSIGGFFGQPDGGPVVVVDKASAPPTWAICDMYYDLHCCARAEGPVQPGQTFTFDYTVKYLSGDESRAMLDTARDVVVTDEDRARHAYPRFELGLNRFDKPVLIDQPDDASGFRPDPPARVWDRQVGHSSKGSLRLGNDQPGRNVWPCFPQTQVPASSIVKIAALARTREVIGRGLFVRLRCGAFNWRPRMHIHLVAWLDSKPIAGTTDGWVQIDLPTLTVPEDHFDYLLWFEVILDGQGVGWLTELDLQLEPLPEAVALRTQQPLAVSQHAERERTGSRGLTR
jgi:hypothetical protein